MRSFYEQLDLVLNTSQEESSPPRHKEHEDDLANEVRLMTIHKAKGKEFPYVVYFDLSSTRAGRIETNMPEERRVAYVGVTRAMDGLLVTADRQKPAPFLKELALNPAFDDFALAYLHRQSKKTERDLNRLGKEIRNLEEKQRSLTVKNPALSQEVLSERINSPTRYGNWLRNKRLKAGTRKKLRLKKESQARQERFTHLTEGLDTIKTEIRFRKLLGEKDDF
jgi:ATP-dependent exoDNAse (exonuclease V) beta subunit